MSASVQVESDTAPAPALDRRGFLRALALAGGAAVLAPRAARPAPQGGTLRIELAAPPAGGRTAAVESAVRGVTLGVEEAARTGGLFGRRVELRAVDAAEALVERDGVAALVGGWDEDSCRALAALAGSAGVLFLNAGCTADALRGPACGRGTFHVEASDAMRRAALAQGRPEGAAASQAALWHPSLERFGAAQLNQRFRARFAAEMDGPAWAGWMAVKALWEASLRARSTDPAALRAHLEREGTQLDGHKGWPLSFRAGDHQLRQPLYLVAGGGARVVGEVPARPADGASSRELLDRLAGTPAACAPTP
jgi:ABC-type branched-subunit amino acid transport system substrate-binding protein